MIREVVEPKIGNGIGCDKPFNRYASDTKGNRMINFLRNIVAPLCQSEPSIPDESRARVERAWDEVFAGLERRKRERIARDSTVIYHTNTS